MNANAEITFEDTALGRVAFASGSAFAVSSSSNPDLVSNLLYDRVFVKNATSRTSIIPTGVEFPDLTIQTTGFTGWNNVALTGNPTAPTAALADNDTSIATTAFVQQELASGTANARNLEVYVRNQTGSTLAAGTIVYINGATGNRPTVTPAQANNDANSAQTFGFVKTSIANNGFGFVIVRGEVENLDTSALTEGVQLYLSPTTAGAYTTTKPSAPQHLVYVGIVVRAHPTQGVILAAIQNGYEVEELHNASITSVANNDLFVYESATSLWKNKSFGTLGLLTSATAASTYLPLDGGTLTGQLRLPNSTASLASLYIYPGDDPASPSTGDIWVDGNGVLRYRLAGVNEYIAYRSWVTSGFALKASPALTGNVTITSNSASPALVITQDGTGDIVQFKDVTSDTTYAFIDANGKVNTIASTTAGAGFNIAHGVAPTTFVDGDVWSTTGGLFWRQNGATKQAMNLGDTQTVSGSITFSNTNLTFGNANGGSTTNVATGPTNSGTSKTVNIGTNGTVNSTTLINVGPVVGLSATSIGNTTAASTLNLATGATLTGTTKVVNIGTSGVSGSTTNITIGSTTGTSTTTLQGITNGVTETAGTSNTRLATTAFVTTADNLKANLDSPVLTGSPLSTTAAADTNSTRIATTAYVVGQASAVTPLADGTAAVGTSLRYARADHVHPTDTSLAPLASPSLTGVPLSTTAAADTNTTQIATTAYVVGQASSTTPSALGAAAVGTSLKYARADHVHQIPLPTGGTTGQVLSKVDGTNYNVQWSTASGGGGAADVQTFTTAGTATWTKPAGKTMVWVRIYGGGGGGGSGARQATTSIRGGGGGGGAGGYIEFFIAAAALAGTVTVTVGAGGTGGAAVAVDSTVGNNGTSGTLSSFSIYRAQGGGSGQAGTSTAGGNGGTTGVVLTGGSLVAAVASGGAGGAAAAPAALAATTTAYHQSTSGGGGAGQVANVTTAFAGAAGGSRNAHTTGLITAIAGGAGGTTAGVVPTAGASGITNWYGGTGAGGGAYRTAVDGMAGAIGGQPGGGGGGGGASDNGFASGAGGNGGAGMVIVVSY
jgi:hypothetical protein